MIVQDEISLSKVKNGEDGQDGVAGADGKGIKSTAVTYQASTSGTTAPTGTWVANPPTVAKGQYLWTRTIWTYTDDTTETGYSVAYVAKDGNNGTDGLAGKDGVGIKTTTIEYAVSTSGTTQPTSDWSGTIPSVPQGQYLWTKTTWGYTDNTSETGYSVAKAGEKGATGEKGENGKSNYIHTAYANSADGTVDFTREWPRENLLLDSERLVRITGYYELYSLSVSADTFTNKTVTISFDAKKDASDSIDYDMYCYFRGKNAVINPQPKKQKLSSAEWIRMSFTLNMDSAVKDAINVGINMSAQTGTVEIKNVKLELGSTATPYLPEGEKLHYIGTYTDFTEQGSDDPSKYEWIKFVGEDGKDGSNGKDGQSATEVVAGYLTNEAMLVPANPQGVVSSFDNATGQFVITEGNKTISTGITYAVKSTVACTASIDAKGNYKVTAMSADLGTIFLTAKYKDITVEKVAIITKAKQGTTGSSGKDGNDGKDGTNGKDGSQGPKGDAGSTGPQGAKGDPTGITVSATAPSSPYTNQLWKNTGTSGGRIKDATYRWNGSAWELYLFTAANISAETLSAIVANLGTVNAGKIINEGSYKDGLTTINYTSTLAGLIEMAWTIANSTQNGSFDISPTGLKSVSYSDTAKKVQDWFWSVGNSGFEAGTGSTAKGDLVSSLMGPDGISMQDYKYKEYGNVNLSYQDLMTMPKTALKPATGYQIYGDSEDNIPAAKRSMGRIITLSGAFANINEVQSSNTRIVMGYVPDWAKPESIVTTIEQGSGMSRFCLFVYPDGTIRWARYGKTDQEKLGEKRFLNIGTTYTAGNL